MRIDIVPMSVNIAWQGKRFKTPKYRGFEKELLFKLKPMKLPPPPYVVTYIFGMSNKLSDWDNPIKPFQDVLQKKYGFNDKDIYCAVVGKKIVGKGEEYIDFFIEHYEN